MWRSRNKLRLSKLQKNSFLLFLALFLLFLNAFLFIFLKEDLSFSLPKGEQKEKVIEISLPIVPAEEGLMAPPGRGPAVTAPLLPVVPNK